MNDINEYELIYMVRSHDETAFKLLLERHNALIWDRIYSYYQVYGGSLPDKSDAYHEIITTFLDVVQIYRMDQKTKFNTFLRQAIELKLNAFCRRSKTKMQTYVSLDDFFEDKHYDVPDTSLHYDPVAFQNCSSLKEDIQIEYDALNEMDKKIIVNYLKGYGTVEVARNLNISRRKCEYVFQKYRDRLRKRLENNNNN